MNIEIQYFEDCPNWRSTMELVAHVASDLDVDAEVSLVLVDSLEEAERLSFRGSPTVKVDGEDPWADTDAPVGLGCRLYRTESGFSGSPSEAQLRDAIRRAAG